MDIYRPDFRGWRRWAGWTKRAKALLLLTNDSEWAARITSPETHLDKTYHVQIGAIGDEELMQEIAKWNPAQARRSAARKKMLGMLRGGEPQFVAQNCFG